MKNYYKILEVRPSADHKDIRAAFLRLSKMYHPDLHQQDKDFEEIFKEIQEAYEVLKNPERRTEYDQYLRLFQLQQSRTGRISIFIRKKLLNRGGARNRRGTSPVYPAVRPGKNRTRVVLLLLFVSLAVTLVFFAEKKFSENSLNNLPLTYKNEPAETEPLIVPEWEIPELPSAKRRPSSERKEKAEKTAVLEQPKKSDLEKDADGVKAAVKPAANEVEKQMPKTSPAAEAEQAVSEANPDLRINSTPKTEEKTLKADEIYTKADKQPSFGGGAPAFVEYLKTNLQYPPAAREKGISGRVLLTFVVEKNGKISNVSVLQGIGSGCDEEAVRVMENAPAWIPGEEKGEKVRVQCTIPITFTLQ